MTLPSDGKWIECNGQSTSGYSDLAAVVGSNVPDYQGVFLRGYGSQTSSHFGSVTHQSDSIGVLQGDSIRNITGATGASLPNAAGWLTGAFARANTGGVGWYADVYGGTSFDASRVVPTANENRPVNKSVKFLIKAI